MIIRMQGRQDNIINIQWKAIGINNKDLSGTELLLKVAVTSLVLRDPSFHWHYTKKILEVWDRNEARK